VTPPTGVTAPPSNARLPDEDFLAERDEVMAQWTIDPIDLDEATAYARGVSATRNVSRLLAQAKADGRTLVEPRAGVASFEGMRQLLAELSDAGSDILPVSLDSLTRTLRFDDALAALERSTTEKSVLNGFPIVAHGVEGSRRLVELFDRPLHMRANAIDLRLASEVAFASGMSGFVSGPIYSTFEYSKKTTLAESIPRWQYVFRLMAHYTEAGVPIANDSIGLAQSGTYSVPSLMHVGVVLDALFMAGQGVKHVIPYAMLQGNLAQDVAACRAVGILTEEYLARCGFDDVEVYTTGSDWNGAFPPDEAAAYSLIALNTLAAGIARTPLIYVKSIEEGVGIPSAAGNAASVRATRFLLHLVRDQVDALEPAGAAFELELSLLESRAILDAVLELGDGDPVQGAIRSTEAGVLDVPFSPNVHAHGDVIPMRDAEGAVRFFDSGRLPIPDEARRLERERLDRRAAGKGAALAYEDLIEDFAFLLSTS
jgi:methylaspartate mutase epsilon subunit